MSYLLNFFSNNQYQKQEEMYILLLENVLPILRPVYQLSVIVFWVIIDGYVSTNPTSPIYCSTLLNFCPISFLTLPPVKTKVIQHDEYSQD